MVNRYWSRAAALLLIAVTVAGCAGQRRILVPTQNTAGAQLAYAERQRKEANLPLIFEKKKEYNLARNMVRQTYQAVVDNFPADREFTPVAKINLIEMDAGLDEQHAPKSKMGDHRAIKDYDALIKEYPENEFVQAKARYDQALLHKRNREFEEAMKLFKHLRDTYAKHANPVIKNIAERSAAYYQETYVIEK
ncbi:MAG: hypothetical protein ABFD69_07725 [Candidatus Sumerlaeia bacterium]